MLCYIIQNLAMGGGQVGVLPTLILFVDPRAVQLVSSSSDADPFGVDPKAVQLVSASSDADPFGVDPRAVQLVQ
jgi:hypothetical protein